MLDCCELFVAPDRTGVDIIENLYILGAHAQVQSITK